MGAFKEELICAICADKFKQPKSLNCSHTFCLRCLQNLMEQHDHDVDVECPTCRHVTEMDVHDGIVANLPTNLVAQNLVDKFELENQRMSAVVKHRCSVHSSEVLCLYCKTCKEMICRECALYVHCKPNHEYVNLGDFVGKLKETSLRKMHQLSDKSAEFKSKFEEFERFHNDWMLSTNQAEFWVKKVAKVVEEKIEKDKREKKALIKDKQEFQTMLFKNYSDIFGTLLEKMKAVVYSKADLDTMPNGEYLGMHETLMESVDHLLKQDLPSFDQDAWKYSVMFQPNDELVNETFSLGTVKIEMGDGIKLKFDDTKKRPRDSDVEGDESSSDHKRKKFCDCKNDGKEAPIDAKGKGKISNYVGSHQSSGDGGGDDGVNSNQNSKPSDNNSSGARLPETKGKVSTVVAMDIEKGAETCETTKAKGDAPASGLNQPPAPAKERDTSVIENQPHAKETDKTTEGHCQDKDTKGSKCPAVDLSTAEDKSVPSPAVEVVVESQDDGGTKEAEAESVGHSDHCYSINS